MINRLIIFMFVCLMSLGATASAGSSETKEDDNLPPLVIETDNLTYAGAFIDWSSSPRIVAQKSVSLHKEPADNSPIVGTVPVYTSSTIVKQEMLPIVGVKAYIYPRMGKTKIIASSERAKQSAALTDTADVNIGDDIYVVYSEKSGLKSVVWYKGKFVVVPSSGIKIPYINSNPEQNYYQGYTYAIYEGYSTYNDIVNEPDMNYYGYYDNGQRYLIKRPVCRRNADIWLQLELPDKTTGWVKITDAHAGANAQPDWWKCYTGFALDCFTGFSPDTHKLLTN